jgi:hypothetical protein
MPLIDAMFVNLIEVAPHGIAQLSVVDEKRPYKKLTIRPIRQFEH